VYMNLADITGLDHRPVDRAIHLIVRLSTHKITSY
jgi:hypothetical protein